MVLFDATPSPPADPQAVAAKIARAPESASDLVFVRRAKLDSSQLLGPCYWMPRGDDLPSEGDAALVAEDDNGRLWIVAWWPYA